MKLSQILFAEHLGFQFKKHWLVQGRRKIIDHGLEDYLKSKGIPVIDALEFIKEKPEERGRIDIVGPYEPPKPEDENHPDFKPRPCFTLKPNNVLLEGISQAQVLTKTIMAENRLPSKIEQLAEVAAPKYVHNEVKKAILSATVFDAEQKKLPKIKDPKRPAQNFPRIYGITDKRRTQILSNRLIQIIEKSSDYEVTESKYVHNDLETKAIFDKEDELFQFHEVSGVMMTSNKPLKHELDDREIPFVEIPDLYPVSHTVTLPPTHFYSETSKFPIRSTVLVRHPHTTWLHHEASEVANIYETEVLPSQVRGRSLTHAFAVAAAYAQTLHGDNVKDLPEPIYLNCIQTDGRAFDIGILKLNTLNLDGTTGVKNVWYCKHGLKMYESCKYLAGIPALEKYNPKVYQYLNAVYNC